MKQNFYLILHAKINLKWIKQLNIRLRTIKVSGENIGNKFLNIGLRNDIFGSDTKSTGKKKIKN